MDIHIASYISTPSEIDSAARVLDRELASTASPQQKFLLIVQFYANVRGLSEDWLRAYFLLLAPTFVELCQHPAVRSFAPGVWSHAYDCLLMLRRIGWFDDAHTEDAVFRQAAVKMVLSHAYVAELRSLHSLLIEARLTQRLLDEQIWSSIFSAGTQEYELFRAYAEVMQGTDSEASPIVTAALDEWERSRGRAGAMSIILLEEHDGLKVPTGRVVLMDILLPAETEGTAQLANTLDTAANATIEQMERGHKLARRFIDERLSGRVPNAELHAYIHETEAAVRGGSLGFACTIGMIARYSQLLNGRWRWLVRPTAAFVGSLHASGSIDMSSWTVIENKLHVAFFSGLEQIVIPAAHREAAIFLVQSLQRRYPNRTLQVVGVTHFSDCFRIPGLIETQERTRVQMLVQSAKRHSSVLLVVFAMLLFGGGGYFAYKAYYDYPDLEHTLGLRVGGSSIVYNPQDTVSWRFRDMDVEKSAVIPFGDLEVGDGFSRTFTIWNMTPSLLELECSLEGADASDWYINHGDGGLTVGKASSAELSVMFSPRTPGASKTGSLVFRHPDEKEILFALTLTGAAGWPRPAGYALWLDGEDDQMFFGQQSTAFDVQEGTFECWYRADTLSKGMLLFNGNTESDGTKHESVFLGFWRRDAAYYRVGAEVGYLNLPREHWLEPGAWTHFALCYSVPKKKIRAYVNGKELSGYDGRFILPGIGRPYVTVGALNDRRSQKLFVRGALDEVRFWHSLRSGEEIRASMHRGLSGREPDLAGYWDMDASVEAYAFNGNKLAHNAELLNRPSLVRSDAPLAETDAGCVMTTTDDGTAAVELQAGSYLLCSRNPLPRYGEATFAFSFRQDKEHSFHFNYLLQERGWISIESNSVFTSGIGDDPKQVEIPVGWHNGVCTVNRSGTMIFYVDGVPIDTSETWLGGDRDWYHHFEGILLGFRADKQNLPGPWNYNWFYPYLNHPRAYGSLRIWSRILDQDEVRRLHAKKIVPDDHLVAEWVLDTLPGEGKNYIDSIGGLQLHVKEVRTWK